jgi:hypothetical protein
MEEEDFRSLALLMHDVVVNNTSVIDQVKALRGHFSELQFCFRGDEYADILQQLQNLL